LTTLKFYQKLFKEKPMGGVQEILNNSISNQFILSFCLSIFHAFLVVLHHFWPESGSLSLNDCQLRVVIFWYGNFAEKLPLYALECRTIAV
jgi:hypothetical protein